MMLILLRALLFFQPLTCNRWNVHRFQVIFIVDVKCVNGSYACIDEVNNTKGIEHMEQIRDDDK